MLYYVEDVIYDFIVLTDFPDIYYDLSYEDQFIFGVWTSGVTQLLDWVQCFAGVGMGYSNLANISDGKEVLQFSFIIDFIYDICIHNGRPFRSHYMGGGVCIHQDFMIWHNRWAQINPQALRYYYRFLNGVYHYDVLPNGVVDFYSEQTHALPFNALDLISLILPAMEPVNLEEFYEIMEYVVFNSSTKPTYYFLFRIRF